MEKHVGKVVIWGATSLGKYLADNIIHNNKKWRPLAFVDNDPKLCNAYISSIPVISYVAFGAMENLGEITVLLAVRNAKNIFQILEQLEHLSVGNIGIVKHEVLLSGTCIDPWSLDEEIIWYVFGQKTDRIVPYIEVNLTDACNLKCKGCTHFSSLYEESSIYPLYDYEKDLRKLRNAGQIFRLRLLGGEPFLIKNLHEYIRITREIFPESMIEIVTNGLLVTKVKQEIMMAIRDYDICISVSLYLPTCKIKKEIEEQLRAYDILYYFDTGNTEREITMFYRNLTLQDTHDAEISNSVCLSSACTFLRRGRIYKCPFDGLVNDFYRYYEVDGKHESGVDLDRNADYIYEKLKEYALRPIKLCRYCSEEPESIPWSVEAKPALGDWLFHDGK